VDPLNKSFQIREQANWRKIQQETPETEIYLSDLDFILKTLVLHFEQLPLTAGRPFFIFTSFGSFTSTLALHFTQ
jgi:hypothetical protein